MTERPTAIGRFSLVNIIYHYIHICSTDHKLENVNTKREPTKVAQYKLKMNNNDQQAVIAIREERARIGGVEVAKKTVIAATDEGLVWLTTQICVALPNI